MTPTFSVIANDTDITDKIRDRLIELSLHDAAGFESDTATIVLDNRDGLLALPETGTLLRISIGYRETGLVDKGLYTIDEPRLSGPPHRLTIGAKAADMLASLKAQRSTSYDGITIRGLVGTIAARHGLTPRVSSAFADIVLNHVDQTDESDMNLLTRLARDRGATAKPANGSLLFVPTGEAKTASGQDLPTIAIDLTKDGGRYEATFADRSSYRAVTARWRDQAGNCDVEVTVTIESADPDAPTYTFKGTYPDAATARAVAKAKLDSLGRTKGTLSLDSIIGKPLACAEAPLTVTGGPAALAEQTWIIRSCDHRLRETGFTTLIDAETKA